MGSSRFTTCEKYHQATPSKVPEEVSEALETLRKNDLITGQHHVQLVDFDWCREAGKRKYPAGINTVDIKWQDVVVPGGFPQFEHDDEMLRRPSWGTEAMHLSCQIDSN